MSTGVQPAVVIGMPAGFGAALETKQALLRSDLCFMTNIGPRGGVQPTVAALKAMMEFAQRPEAETA